MHISPTIHYNAGHSYKINTHCNTEADEFWCIEISFLPGKISSLTPSVMTSSVLTNYVSVYVCTVQVLVEAHAVEQCRGFAPGKYNCSINPLLVMFTSPNSIFVLRCSMSSVINPRRACAARVTVLGRSVCLSVCLSVCYHVFCHHAQQTGQKVTPTGSALHWLDFETGDFRKSTSFESYGVKTK